MESFVQVARYFLKEATRKLGHLERIQYLKIAFAAFGIFIIWTTFKYTVLENTYYKTLADKQQTIIVKNPVSR